MGVDSATRTMSLAHSIFEMAERVGFNMTLLDIGDCIYKPSSVISSFKEVTLGFSYKFQFILLPGRMAVVLISLGKPDGI